MRLHEYEALDVFEQNGIPVPRRGLASTTQDALRVASAIGYPVVLKAQVLVGGRGLAGGVKVVNDAEEAKKVADTLFATQIKGCPVGELLVCEKVDIAQELYLGYTIDGYSGKPVFVVSTEGGVLIEQTAKKAPEKIASCHIEPPFTFQPYQARAILRKLGLQYDLLAAWADVLTRLYKVAQDYESLICEINPLVILRNGKLMAIDAVLEVDDSAVSRIKLPLPNKFDRIDNALERKGKQIGVTYVDLDGDIGLIASGAGLGMASMDIIGNKMKPANFLETGGGITADLLYKCMELIMSKPGIRAIFINVYGGINPIHEGARGVANYIKEHNLKLPIVAKALGNRQEETWEIFRSAGVDVVTEAATEKSIDRLYELVGRG